MLTMGLYGLLAIAVMAAVFFVVASLLPAGEQIAPAVRDESPWELPAEQALGADDVASLRLPVALRGYRFAEVDQLLDRLGEELRARDRVISRLRGDERGGPSDGPRQPADPLPQGSGDSQGPGLGDPQPQQPTDPQLQESADPQPQQSADPQLQDRRPSPGPDPRRPGEDT